MMYKVFSILSTIVLVYTILCFLRILITWIPTISYSRFSRFLSRICDPYLNIFRRIRWLQLGAFDFSAALGLCILGVISSLLQGFSGRGVITFGIVCQMIVNLTWSVITSLISFLILILLIRLILLIVKGENPYYQSPILTQIDSSLAPLVNNISKTFTAGKRISYKSALIISIIALIIFTVIGSILISYLCKILGSLPF